MAKDLIKAKFKDKLPLGGIATGHLYLGCDGSVSGKAPTFFAVKAEKDGELFDARVIQSTVSDGVSLPCFEKAEALCYFPFSEISFSDSSFPADVKMLGFSPFIPLNDTDSGIPAVTFEFEVTNKASERIDFSVCCVSANVNENAYNRMGCTDTGEAYIHLSGDSEGCSNTCIATSGKNVSFCEYVSSTDGFIKNFTKNETLYNKTKSECPVNFASGALCTHFSLGEGEVQRVVFCLSWYSPMGETSRNYYAQYFESSLECASYIFRHTDRLRTASMEFCENVLGATLSSNVLEDINSDLFRFSGMDYVRLEDGALISGKKQEFSGMESFISRSGVLTSLFPTLEYSEVEHLYKTDIFENAKSDELLLLVLRSYRKYVLCGDVDALIEDWYYIVKCMEAVFGEDGQNTCREGLDLQSAAVEAAANMAEAVNDKKRYELYSSMLERLPLGQFSMDIAEGFSRINEISGFEYDAVRKHIGFYPKSDSCPLDIGNTFRCFFCTPQGYGYVEEGIDYIEINLLHGSLFIRSFGVPRVPRLVQYGGRNWKFQSKNLVAVLDSDLEITPSKKLTILIDIKQ